MERRGKAELLNLHTRLYSDKVGFLGQSEFGYLAFIKAMI